MTHKLTLLETVPLTSDTRLYVFTKPDGYQFAPGQATELALDVDGWRDEGRPFTFTSAPDADVLSFVIKSYPDHDGVTKQLPALQPGDTALIGDAWGAIEDKGPGVFIAGGAGITPFIGILQARMRQGGLARSHLIFANTTRDDIILRPLWDALDGLKTTYVLSDDDSGDRQGQLDAEMLDGLVNDWSQTFYVCGPPAMEEAVVEVLTTRGVTDDRIVRED
ncbi:MAG: flavodoxin reductase [Paracoccaceae bacterium]